MQRQQRKACREDQTERDGNDLARHLQACAARRLRTDGRRLWLPPVPPDIDGSDDNAERDERQIERTETVGPD